MSFSHVLLLLLEPFLSLSLYASSSVEYVATEESLHTCKIYKISTCNPHTDSEADREAQFPNGICRHMLEHRFVANWLPRSKESDTRTVH